MPRPLHIGIVGCSAEGAALCYRTICSEGAAMLGPHAHPEVSLHTASLADYVGCLDRGDLQGVADLMLDSARKLAAGGADFLVCPDNTIHQAFSMVEPASPLPWLHIAEVVASEAAARGYRRLGLTGTRWLVASNVYPEKLALRGLELVRPSDDERDEMGRLIMDELVVGVFRPTTVEYFQAVIRNLQARNCDAVILGCTEIPLIIDDRNSPLPTLDSTRLLARAALRRAVLMERASMKPRITVVTLGVDDLERAVRFYSEGLGFPTEGIVGREFEFGAVAFFDMQPGLRLALWPRRSLAHDSGLSVSGPSQTDLSLGHNVRSKEEVDAVMARAEAAGARIIKSAKETFWGGYAGYFQDPDQHLWEVVWNPQWQQ